MKNILTFFEATVEKYPNKIGFSDDKTEQTFAQTMDMAKRIGTVLSQYGKNRPVAIVIDRNCRCINAMLGVLYAGFLETVLLRGGMEMSHATALRVDAGSAEAVCGNVFVCDAFDHFWSGYEHLADVVDHKNKVSDPRTIYGSTSTVSGDNGNLRNVSGCHCIIIEDLTIAGKGVDAFLDPGSAGIVDPDDGAAVFNRHLDGIGDL